MCLARIGRFKGKQCPMWKGGIYKSKEGYVYILSPYHPFRDKRGYVLKHRLIIENHLKRFLKKTEVVHHINGNVVDNKIENLKLFTNASEHLKYHHYLLRNLVGLPPEAIKAKNLR